MRDIVKMKAGQQNPCRVWLSWIWEDMIAPIIYFFWFFRRVVSIRMFGTCSECCVEAVIFVNAIFICFATDYEMMNLSPVVSPEDQVSMAELWLASFYVVELALKLVVHGFYFFWNSEMAWNWLLNSILSLSYDPTSFFEQPCLHIRKNSGNSMKQLWHAHLFHASRY